MRECVRYDGARTETPRTHRLADARVAARAATGRATRAERAERACMLTAVLAEAASSATLAPQHGTYDSSAGPVMAATLHLRPWLAVRPTTAASSRRPAPRALAARGRSRLGARRVVACSDGNGASAPRLESTPGGVTGAASLAPPPKTAASEYAFLAQFASVKWYEMLAGCAYVLLMAEGLRFVVEAPAPLAPKLAAGALVGLLFDFSQRAFLQTRGALTAAAAGRNVLQFQLLCAMKIMLELTGAALVSLKGLGCEGAGIALLGHLVFNLLNDQAVTFGGVVTSFPAEARKPLIVTDALLVATCVGASLARGPVLPVVFAGAFAAFAAVYLFFKFVLNKNV